MKFFIRIMSLLFLVSTINCSKSSGPTISIAGTWMISSQAITGCTNSNSNYSSTFTCPATATKSCIKITFNSNGSFTSEYSMVVNGSTTTSNGSGTYSINGNKITIDSETDTFVLSGNTLTITSAKDASSGCITTTVLSK